VALPNVDWQQKAACVDVDPQVFFPAREDDSFAARKICCDCPVRMDCLVYAIENRIEFGIWGGWGVRARRRIKKRGTFT
jgi:WhiB family redox-sensing transcriptional regulator